MKQLIYLQNDLRQIMRDPITGALLFAPVLIIAVFKIFIVLLFPYVLEQTGIDLSQYHGYVFSFLLLLISGLSGVVTGFVMIDDKDCNIAELMSVTPLGRIGYLANRLMLTGFLTFVYSLLAYFITGIITLNFFIVILLASMQAAYSSIIGMLLFSGADDKVKGLTYAKALNVIMLFSLTDLLALPWLTTLSWFFPSYWTTKVVLTLHSFIIISIALSVHVAWFVILLVRFLRKQSGF